MNKPMDQSPDTPSEIDDRIEQLYDEATALPRGKLQIALLEEAIRLADTHADERVAFMLRDELVEASTFGGRPELTIVHFSWCLAKADANPDEYDLESLLWRYKWLLNALCRFPSISRDKIDSMFADFKRRADEFGNHEHATLVALFGLQQGVGDLQAAKETGIQFETLEPTWLSDCAACVADNLIELDISLFDYKSAISRFNRMQKLKMRCAEKPLVTYPMMIEPYLKMDMQEKAEECYKRSLSKLLKNPNHLGRVGYLFQYLSATEDHDKAAKVLRSGLELWSQSSSILARFEFALGPLEYMGRFTELMEKSIRVTQPEENAFEITKGKAKLADVHRWLRRYCVDLAAQFDARNGNDFYSSRIPNERFE
jgi:tetratricopeptide (TPR) repeat protein